MAEEGLLTAPRARLRLALALVLAAGASAAVTAAAPPALAQDPEPDEELKRPERMTVGVADDLLGQLSPDGKTLYFVSNRNTTSQIFAQNVADGRSHILFDEDADVTWPRVSPDGRALLYVSFGERATGQLCVRALPDGGGRRCLDDPAAALQAEWIDAHRVALVSRPSATGDLRVVEVTVGGSLSARPLLVRNLTSPAVSPDGRYLVYVPVERSAPGVGPAFAARASPWLEAARIGSEGPPARVDLDLPGLTGQPAFARDGKSIYVVQFFSDSNHDGVIDGDDHGVLFRVPISFTGEAPVLGPPEQLTDTSWNCEYPAPAPDRLIATCSRDQDLDVYTLPLDGEVPAEWTVDRLTLAIENAGSRPEQQLLASRRLARETSPTARRLSMLGLTTLHLDLEEYRAAQFYAEHVAALHDHETAGVSHPLLALVEQRRAVRARERGRTLAGFGAGARERLAQLQPKATASAAALTLSHVVRSEIADSIGDKTQARTELEAATIDATTPAPVVDLYYRRADALYRGLDDPEALAAACRMLSEDTALSLDERLRYARAAVRALVRGLAWDEADALLGRLRASADPDSEMAFAIDLARAVLAIRDDHAPRAVRDALLALYAQQTRPGRRSALIAEAVRRTSQVGADRELVALAQRWVDDVPRGARERRAAERLFRRVMTSRAFHRAAEKRFAEARADFDAVAEQTGSYEAVASAIDMRLKAGEAPGDVRASYEKAGGAAPLTRFADAYVIARQLPKLEGEEHEKAAAEAMAALRASWSEFKGQRIAQSLDGALLHEEYLRTGDPASAEKANVHYLVALQLMGQSPRFRAMILGQLGLLHTEVGNYRIALAYLEQRDKLPYSDNAEGLAVHMARARALLHVGRDGDAAAAADAALAMLDRTPTLSRYRLPVLDRAAVDNLAAGRYARALSLYDLEIPALDGAPASPSAERNRFVTRLARAAAAIGAGQSARALDDLDEVARRLADPRFIAGLHWPHASGDHVARTYRLIACGLRARSARELGRFDAEEKAIAERRAILDANLQRTGRVEVERATALAESELALNAGERHDRAGAGAWLAQALARADDLRARGGGAIDTEQLEVLSLAARLTVSMGATLVQGLPERLDAASAAIAARPDPALRPYQRRFEIYRPLLERPQAAGP